MYDYRCQDREYLYRRREQLLPRRPVNAYFLYTAPKSNRSKNARFKGITAETTPVT